MIVQLADALVTAMNGATFSLPLVAKRTYHPVLDLSDLADLHVSVVPRAKEIHSFDRHRNENQVSVDVGVQKRVSQPIDNGEVDALLALCEEIGEFFKLARPPAYPSAAWIKTEHNPIFYPEHLENQGVFTSVLTFTFKVIA